MIDIITLGDPILRKKSDVVAEINDEARVLIDEMFQSMYAEKGVGLAAVQIGRLLRIVITSVVEDKPRVFINPEITATSIEEEVIEEGCLSIPGMTSYIKRPVQVRVQAQNENGKLFVVNTSGLLARVVQHEIDHLNGVLFIDYLDKKERKKIISSLKRKVRV